MLHDLHKLWHFHGGLRLPGHKHESTRHPLAVAAIPERLVLPLHQHIGAPAEPVVEVGQRVARGELVARAAGFVSAPVHASSSGTVVAIGERAIPHPSGFSALCIVIDTDGRDTPCMPGARPVDYARLDPSALRNRIREAGVVGLGGAGFPSFIKLNPGPGKAVETLILNGAECEPYISCDDMLMRERAQEVLGGIRIMRHALQARRCIIGIEDNKPQAAAALRAALSPEERPLIEVVMVPTRYPAGGEKQLIRVLTGREVPADGLPLDIGVVCHNVATAASVHRAVNSGEPLISRIVTVTGGGVREPRNLEVRIGTPISALIAECGGYTEDARRLIMGGPMMGFTLRTDELPVVKTTNCVLVQGAAELAEPQPERVCIRCGECVRVCPANLLPQQLYWYAHARDFDKVQDYNLFDCIECGCCAYVCPSQIPLVQYYRYAKTEIWAQEREKQKADLARRRHEARLQRLEHEKAEREARLRQKKAALEQSTTGGADPKKAAIQAALQRVRAKQGASEGTGVNDAAPPSAAEPQSPEAEPRHGDRTGS